MHRFSSRALRSLSVFTAVLSSAALSSAQSAADFAGLKVGTVHTFETPKDFAFREYVTTKCVDVRNINDLSCYVVERYLQAGDPSEPKNLWRKSTIYEIDYLNVREDGIYLVRRDNYFKGECSVETFSTPLKVLNAKDPESAWTDRFDQTNEYPKNWWMESLAGRTQTSPKTMARAQIVDEIEIQGVKLKCLRVTSTFENSTEIRWYAPSVGLVKMARGGWSSIITDPIDAGTSRIVDMKLDDGVYSREVAAESVEAPAGVVTTFSRSRTISREVRYEKSAGVDVEVGGELATSLWAVRAELTAKVKASLESKTGEKLEVTETREQKVEIDGAKLSKASLCWVDTYRKGVVTLKIDGKDTKVPFEFPISTKLVVKSAS